MTSGNTNIYFSGEHGGTAAARQCGPKEVKEVHQPRLVVSDRRGPSMLSEDAMKTYRLGAVHQKPNSEKNSRRLPTARDGRSNIVHFIHFKDYADYSKGTN